jgi:hypothetical protein
MRELFILIAHLLVTLAKLARPGGLGAVAAESLAVKHQLLIMKRAPLICGHYFAFFLVSRTVILTIRSGPLRCLHLAHHFSVSCSVIALR